MTNEKRDGGKALILLPLRALHPMHAMKQEPQRKERPAQRQELRRAVEVDELSLYPGLQRLAQQGTPAERLVLAGCAAGKWPVPAVPDNTIVIHGEQDEVIPLTNVFEWARPQEFPVIVVPGAGHFFHRKLHFIKNTVTELWRT
jgi:pimeloyl-ACP methyl ester carboxylesterase